MSERTYKKLLIDFRKIRNNYKVSGKVAQLYTQLSNNSDILKDEESIEYFMKDVANSFFNESKSIAQWKSHILDSSRKIINQLDNIIENVSQEKFESGTLDDDAEDLFRCLKRYVLEETDLLDDKLLKRDINGEEFADLLLDYVLLVDIANDKVDFAYKNGGK